MRQISGTAVDKKYLPAIDNTDSLDLTEDVELSIGGHFICKMAITNTMREREKSLIKFVNEKGSNFVIKMNDTWIPISYGVFVVFGKAGYGKTATMNAIAEGLSGYKLAEDIMDTDQEATDKPISVARLKLGEPEDGALINMGAWASGILADFVQSKDDIDVMVVDSIKNAVYAPKGETSTGPGGFNMTLSVELSQLDATLRKLGKTLFVVLNPATKKDDIYENIREIIKTSVEGMVEATAINADGEGTATFESRYLGRDQIHITYSQKEIEREIGVESPDEASAELSTRPKVGTGKDVDNLGIVGGSRLTQMVKQ